MFGIKQIKFWEEHYFLFFNLSMCQYEFQMIDKHLIVPIKFYSA